MSEFFAMGGYGLYVWSCFGITALVMAGLAASSWRSWQRQMALFTELEEAQSAASPASESGS